MKKIILLFISVFVLLNTCLAESIDVSALSDNELIALNDSVMEELDKRNLKTGSQFFPGVYIVGKDIKSGKYTMETEVIDNNELPYCKIRYFESEEAYANNEDLHFDLITEAGYQMNLNEGNVIELYNCNLKMWIKRNEADWVP